VGRVKGGVQKKGDRVWSSCVGGGLFLLIIE
jgi:hypothetical protein